MFMIKAGDSHVHFPFSEVSGGAINYSSIIKYLNGKIVHCLKLISFQFVQYGKIYLLGEACDDPDV